MSDQIRSSDIEAVKDHPTFGNVGLFFSVAGSDDDEKSKVVSGPDDFLDVIIAAGDRSPRRMMRQLSRVRASSSAPPRLRRAVSRIGRIARTVQSQAGRLEAEYMRRPNNLCAIYTTSLAPGATVAFSIQPGAGMSFYRLLNFICGDDTSDRFGFTSLRVGGVEHVNQTQTTPAAPVANLVPWTVFQLKESRGIANIAPWSGQLFDNNTPITGIIGNGTVAATGDAFTGAARINVLTQVDPCGQRYQQAIQNAQRYWGALENNLSLYAPNALGR